jgi:hypothetical protein
MAAAVTSTGTIGRIAPPFVDLSVIPVTVVATATVYATAGGGLPIDLTKALTSGAQPFDMAYINPLDVIGVLPLGLSTNGFLPVGLTVGVFTFGAPVWPFTGASQTSIQPDQSLATCPATIRLLGTGAANHGAFGEVADGAVTDTFSFLLIVLRNGENN